MCKNISWFGIQFLTPFMVFSVTYYLYNSCNVIIFRATSHTSQGPWPCDGECPWLPSKGRTMGVGPSSIVWSENGPCWGTIVYFIGGKRGATLPLYTFTVVYRFSSFLLVLYWWEKKEEHDESSWEKREDSYYIDFILVVAHVLDMQVLALNGGWENALFGILKRKKNMNNCSVWTFERSVGFTNRLLLDSFTEKCLSKELVYLIMHSRFFVSG